MKNDNHNDTLLCFFCVHKNKNEEDIYYMIANYFYIDDNIIIDDDSHYDIYKYPKSLYIKSTINYIHSEAFICLIDEEGEMYFFNYRLGYGIIKGNSVKNYTCLNEFYGMKINYYMKQNNIL